MGNHRRQFSATLKAKIAVGAIKGQRTVQEIGSSYAVHPNQVTKWKKQLLDFSPEDSSAQSAGSAAYLGPENPYLISGKSLIVGDDRQAFQLALCDQHAVKGIIVVQRKVARRQRMLCGDLQF